MADILRLIFKCLLLNEKLYILFQISPKFVPDNKSTLVQVIAWCGTGGKPLPEPMMTKLYDTKLRSSLLELVQIDGLVQDCSNSIANAMALLQSCTKPLKSRKIIPSCVVRLPFLRNDSKSFNHFHNNANSTRIFFPSIGIHHTYSEKFCVSYNMLQVN